MGLPGCQIKGLCTGRGRRLHAGVELVSPSRASPTIKSVESKKRCGLCMIYCSLVPLSVVDRWGADFSRRKMVVSDEQVCRRIKLDDTQLLPSRLRRALVSSEKRLQRNSGRPNNYCTTHKLFQYKYKIKCDDPSSSPFDITLDMPCSLPSGHY